MRIIRKQLKKLYPNWKKLPKKQKRAIAKAVLKESRILRFLWKNHSLAWKIKSQWMIS
jgi:hypothetical protein